MRRWIILPGLFPEPDTTGGVEHWLFAIYDALTVVQQLSVREAVRKMVASEGGAPPDLVEPRRKEFTPEEERG